MNARNEEMMKTAARRGTKRTCDNDDCGRKFYDLNISPTDCPYCGALFSAPIKKAVETKVSGTRLNFKSYKIRQEPAEIGDAVREPEVPAVDIDDEETAEPASEEIPEIEEEVVDETLSVDIKDRGDI